METNVYLFAFVNFFESPSFLECDRCLIRLVHRRRQSTGDTFIRAPIQNLVECVADGCFHRIAVILIVGQRCFAQNRQIADNVRSPFVNFDVTQLISNRFVFNQNLSVIVFLFVVKGKAAIRRFSFAFRAHVCEFDDDIYLFTVLNVHNDLAQTLLWCVTSDIVIDTVMMMFTMCVRFPSCDVIIIHLHTGDTQNTNRVIYLLFERFSGLSPVNRPKPKSN